MRAESSITKAQNQNAQQITRAIRTYTKQARAISKDTSEYQTIPHAQTKCVSIARARNRTAKRIRFLDPRDEGRPDTAVHPNKKYNCIRSFLYMNNTNVYQTIRSYILVCVGIEWYDLVSLGIKWYTLMFNGGSLY